MEPLRDSTNLGANSDTSRTSNNGRARGVPRTQSDSRNPLFVPQAFLYSGTRGTPMTPFTHLFPDQLNGPKSSSINTSTLILTVRAYLKSTARDLSGTRYSYLDIFIAREFRRQTHRSLNPSACSQQRPWHYNVISIRRLKGGGKSSKASRVSEDSMLRRTGANGSLRGSGCLGYWSAVAEEEGYSRSRAIAIRSWFTSCLLQ